MSNLYDANKKLISQPAPQTQDSRGNFRYKDVNATVIDWFDTHDRPVEEKAKVTKVVVENDQPVAVIQDTAANAAIDALASDLDGGTDGRSEEAPTH